jgi:hypothetical protein
MLDHTPPSSAEVKKELSYTSTHPMGPPGPVMGFPLPPLFLHTHEVRKFGQRYGSRLTDSVHEN